MATISEEVRQPRRSRGTGADLQTMTLRLPKDIAFRLRQAAERNQRSLNSEIIIALERHVARELGTENDS